jgi:hypothetical protein
MAAPDRAAPAPGRAARLLDSVPLALAWRYATHALMLALALWNERRPAPHLPDLVLDQLPRVEWIARHNYHLWLAAYVPIALLLWRRSRAQFLRFLWLGGVLSLVRGVCIPLTGLGPVHGLDANAGASCAQLWSAWLALVNPVTALTGDAAHVSLTKDLFFSGHVASTFLLWLACRRVAALGPWALAAHLVVVASVFLAHLHYTIDVVGAYAITWALWLACEARWPSAQLTRP